MARSRNRFSRRLYVVGFLCTLPVLAVFARMYWVSIVTGQAMVDYIGNNVCRETVKMAYRGPILDRNGSALATSMQAYDVGRVGRFYRYDAGQVAKLAPILGVPAGELRRKLQARPGDFLYLSKNVGVDEATAIRRLGIRGIEITSKQRRSYPNGPMAAHIVGFSGADARGKEGIELALDTEIRGSEVAVHVCRDASGGSYLDQSDLAGVNQGATVRLTIDATLQSAAESELERRVEEMGAMGGSVVMLDPATGEVLALANWPEFDPNRQGSFPRAALRDRALTDVFDPGSTAKAMLMAAALDAGVITEASRFDCENGHMRIGGRTIHDHKPHGVLSVPEILKVSSNICSAKIGAELGAEKLHDYLHAFGFGSRVGIDLPGEVPGILRPAKNWRAIDLANISFGQGISVTALQLASAFATIANDGARMRPYVVQEVVAADGRVLHRSEPTKLAQVVSPRVARSVAHMLTAVVSDEGTAPQAMVEGIVVAGKTGTAQKVVDGRYSRQHWIASFVGFLPVDDPRVVIAVVIDEPHRFHYGGVVAAPVFRHIAESSLDYLHVHRSPVLKAPSISVATTRLGAPDRHASGKLGAFGRRYGMLRPHAGAGSPPGSAAGAGSATAGDGRMPDLQGMSLRAAMRALAGCECRIRPRGTGYVVAQTPAAGEELDGLAPVELTLAPLLAPTAARR